MGYSNQVKLKPFSDRYVQYYIRCFSNQINCLEGAYRAGKSVINIYSFANYLEYCVDKIHLVSGASVATARLNVSDCNGLGLSYIFRGRCKTGKYEGNECLKIKSKTGGKIVVFVGGGQSDSYKKIQGLSFGSWLSVELANLYISNDEKCFIDMALSRLTQSHDLKVWWDLNPVYPSHNVYKKYLDHYENQQAEGNFYGGYNFMRCSLFDNTALSDEQRMSFLSRYPDKNSMEYQRYILGNRACAEGLIFSNFAKDKSPWVVDDLSKFCQSVQKQFISIGVDFGGNDSDTTFVATLFYNNYHGICIVASDKLIMAGGESDAKDFNNKFKEFILFVSSLDICPIRYAFGDCADPVMISEMRNVVKELKLANQVRVLNCQKHTIKKRIDTKKVLMSTMHWFVYKDAITVIESTETQVWDNREGHEDERLDNGSVDIDTADAEEYSWSGFLDKLIAFSN